MESYSRCKKKTGLVFGVLGRTWSQIAVWVFLVLGCQSHEGVRVIQGGESDFRIRCNTASAPAATLLQRYVTQVTGVELPIIHEMDGDTNQTITLLVNGEGDEHGVHYTVGNGMIRIEGGSPKALRNAVYLFLEKEMGFQWWAPDADIVSKEPDVVLSPTRYTYTPPITTRTVHSKLYYENSEFADWHKVTDDAFPGYVPTARVHTFHRFMPEEDFYGTHPEYYALRGERRLPTQLCLTNESVLQIVKDSVRAYFNRFPEAQVISVSQDDNQQYCQCPQCAAVDKKEGSPSGSMIHFVNRVAESFPDKIISTLAYQHTRKPCITKPRENVLITLCSIECDRSAPIAEKCGEFAKDLEGWSQLTDNIRIWDYTTQFTNFLAPFPNMHTLQPNMALFNTNNAKWIFEQHSHHPSELFELRSYLTAQLLWNPNQDWLSLVDTFCNGYYGDAGNHILEYVKAIHTHLGKEGDFVLFLYGDPSQAFDSFLSPEQLKGYQKMFDRAEEAVADNEVLLNRVKKARLGVDYAALEMYRKNHALDYKMIDGDTEGNMTVNPDVERLLDGFLETCRTNDISLMNEMGFTVTEYGANYKATLETARRPNKAKYKTVTTLTSPKKYAGENPNVLTDGALGGSSFYANWLGYEGHDMTVVVDLGTVQPISEIGTTFLQVTNHIVFFPAEVTYAISTDGEHYHEVAIIANPVPLTKKSKINDLQGFEAQFETKPARYIKVNATNVETPYWHHAAGLPSWVFADEIIIN